MHLSRLCFTLALASSTLAQQAIIYDAIHNATSLFGTWSSGSKAVRTGSGFANPASQSFAYPPTTGISFSFDDDWYEIARYRFFGNGSEPTCITGVILWVHGRYTLNPNGSITMTPLGDGYQQIQDPCAAVSNFIEPYNLTELFVNWRIFQDPETRDYKLHLFQYDGAPLSPMFLVSPQANMLPKRLLRNVTTSPGQTGLLSQNPFSAPGQLNSGSERRVGRSAATFIVGMSAIGLLSLVI